MYLFTLTLAFFRSFQIISVLLTQATFHCFKTWIWNLQSTLTLVKLGFCYGYTPSGLGPLQQGGVPPSLSVVLGGLTLQRDFWRESAQWVTLTIGYLNSHVQLLIYAGLTKVGMTVILLTRISGLTLNILQNTSNHFVTTTPHLREKPEYQQWRFLLDVNNDKKKDNL